MLKENLDELAQISLKEGIIHILYKPGCYVDEKEMRKLVAIRKKVAEGISRPCLIDARGVKY